MASHAAEIYEVTPISKIGTTDGFFFFLNVVWLQNFYAEGARKIVILNALPVGCLPMPRTLSGGLRRECVEELNQAAQIFNSKLVSVVDSFNGKYTDAKAAIMDVYNPLLRMIKNQKQNGMRKTDIKYLMQN